MAQQIKRLPKNLSWIPVMVEGGKTTSQSCPLTSTLSPWLHMHQTHIKKDGWGRRNVKKNIATILSPWSFSELLYHSHGIGGLNQKLQRIPCSPGWIPSACGCGPGSSVSAVIPSPTCQCDQYPDTLLWASVSLSRPSRLAMKNQTGKWFFSLLGMMSAEQALGLVVFIPISLELRRLSDISMQAWTLRCVYFPGNAEGLQPQNKAFARGWAQWIPECVLSWRLSGPKSRITPR